MTKRSLKIGKRLCWKARTVSDEGVKQGESFPQAASHDWMLQMIRELQLQKEDLQRLIAARETSRKQLVTALRDREWKFRALFEHGPIGVAYNEILYDSAKRPVDFRFLDANQTYLKLTPVDPRGKTAKQVFVGIENEPFNWIGTFGEVTRTGKMIRFEKQLPQRNLWFDCVAYQFQSDHVVTMFLDITAKKKAEEALKKSEKKYRLIVNYSHDIICMLTVEGNLSFVSPAWTKLLGHQVLDVTGKPLQFYVHPNDFSRLRAWLKKTMDTRTVLACEEYRVLHSDGSWRWHTASAVPIWDENGKPVGFYSIARDITEHRQAEDKLRESESLYHALVDQSFEALALVDVQTQELVEVNRRFTERLGYSLPEDAPLYVIDVVVDSQDNIDKLYNETIHKTGVLPPDPIVLRHKNGAEVPVERAARMIEIAGRQYLLSSIRDMTEERQRQKELAERMEELRTKQELLEKINALLVESQTALLQQASHDSLTGLPNHRSALETLAIELERSKRHGEGLAIGLCDIDSFKTINDKWGHQVGDELLCWFAQNLVTCVRAYDTVARMGADEFLLILPVKSAADAVTVFERCFQHISTNKMQLPDGEEFSVSTSIGVAFAAAETDVKSFLSKADAALQQAKAQGYNRVIYSMKS